MARPRKSELRDRQLNLSLTAAELANIEQRAAAIGMRPVHFSRALLFDEGRKLAAPSEPRDNNVLRLTCDHLARLGNNLNQMVRHLHRTGDPLPADLEPLLTDIRRIIARVQL